MNLLQLMNTDLGVNTRRVQGSMTEQLLDIPDVGSILQHQRSTGMPEQMA